MPDLLSFRQALRRARGDKKPHLLLGNGFSRACRDDIFAYGALFERADFDALSPQARAAFDVLGTTDFEVVMRALRNAAALLRVYDGKESAVARHLRGDADGLREVLVNAISSSHPDLPGDIDSDAYAACRSFLSYFDRVYTLNYDLLLYWAVMQEELEPELRCDDGFRTPDQGEAEYVTWEVENTYRQNLFYLHGALHIFDSGEEIKKYTWVNTGVRLMDQVREALVNGFYPLFVAEGESSRKLARIKHSDYLSRGYRSFGAIGGTLFIYGHSFADNDAHIMRLIRKGKVERLFVSLYGKPNSLTNRQIVSRANEIAAARPNSRPLGVEFYQAESAAVWG